MRVVWFHHGLVVKVVKPFVHIGFNVFALIVCWVKNFEARVSFRSDLLKKHSLLHFAFFNSVSFFWANNRDTNSFFN